MRLVAGCPRCASSVADTAATDTTDTAESTGGLEGWSCPAHGPVTPLWRPATVSYEAFAEHLRICQPLQSWLPWPLTPGWRISDFGCVGRPGRDPVASFVTLAGTSDLDGMVEITLVSEEPGVGLGARCAAVDRTDPGADIGDGPPQARVRIDGHPIALWAVSTSDCDVAFDRSVFAGEAHGRWLWVVLRPASAGLLLSDTWTLQDLGDLGPEVVALPFGNVPRTW